MGDYRGYRLRGLMLPPLLLVYCIIAVAASPPNRTELFPFFSWSLFSRASSTRSDVALLIRSVDGEPLSEPRLFYEMADQFAAARTGDSRLSKLLDQLAYFVRRSDRSNIARLRAVVEGNFLRDAMSVDYDLVRIEYNPIDRYRSGELKRVAILGSFSTEPSQ